MVSFTVPGVPTPWARAGRKGGFSYTPGKQRAAMADVRVIAANALNGRPLLIGPLELALSFTYPWPGRISAKKRGDPLWSWKDTRPDTSNLIKLIEDALNGVVYCDDGQIARHTVEKKFGDRAEAVVTIRQLRPLEAAA